LIFKRELAIENILQGKKTMTSRSKQLHEVGDTTNLMADRDYSKSSGKYIKMTKVYRKAISEFTDIDAKQRGFREFKEWKPIAEVWVHGFEVVGTQ